MSREEEIIEIKKRIEEIKAEVDELESKYNKLKSHVEYIDYHLLGIDYFIDGWLAKYRNFQTVYKYLFIKIKRGVNKFFIFFGKVVLLIITTIFVSLALKIINQDALIKQVIDFINLFF